MSVGGGTPSPLTHDNLAQWPTIEKLSYVEEKWGLPEPRDRSESEQNSAPESAKESSNQSSGARPKRVGFGLEAADDPDLISSAPTIDKFLRSHQKRPELRGPQPHYPHKSPSLGRSDQSQPTEVPTELTQISAASRGSRHSELNVMSGIASEGFGNADDGSYTSSQLSRRRRGVTDIENGRVETSPAESQADRQTQEAQAAADRIDYVANLNRAWSGMSAGVFGESTAKGIAALIHTGLTKYGASLLAEGLCAQFGWSNPLHVVAAKMIIGGLAIGMAHHVLETGGKNFMAPFFGGRILEIKPGQAVEQGDTEALAKIKAFVDSIKPGQAVPDSLHIFCFGLSSFIRADQTSLWILVALQSFGGGFLIASLLSMAALKQKVVTQTRVHPDLTNPAHPVWPQVETFIPDAGKPDERFLVVPTHAASTSLVSPFKSSSLQEFRAGFFESAAWEGTGDRLKGFAKSLLPDVKQTINSATSAYLQSAEHKPKGDAPELHRGTFNQLGHAIGTRTWAAASGIGGSELLQTAVFASRVADRAKFSVRELQGPLVTIPYLFFLTANLWTHAKRNPHEFGTAMMVKSMNPFREGLRDPTKLVAESIGIHADDWGKAGKPIIAIQYLWAASHAMIRGAATAHTNIAFDLAHEATYPFSTADRKRQISRIKKVVTLDDREFQASMMKFMSRLVGPGGF